MKHAKRMGLLQEAGAARAVAERHAGDVVLAPLEGELRRLLAGVRA